MRKLLIICVLSQLSFFGFSQDFAPVGATWHYYLNDVAGMGDQRIVSQSDTLIDGKNCRKLLLDNWFHDYINDQIVYNAGPTQFVSDSSGVYYVYQDGKFRVLYDFNVAPGNFWVTDLKPGFFGECDSMGKIFVDSTGTDLIDGSPLKWIKVHDSSTISGYFLFNIRIYEKLGSLSFLFPYPACFVYEIGYSLRCYVDSQLNYPSIGACDFIITGNESLNLPNAFELYPNPTSEKLVVSGTSFGEGKTIKIFDLRGIEVKSIKQKNYQTEVSIDDLPSGIYFIKTGEQIGKFIKE